MATILPTGFVWMPEAVHIAALHFYPERMADSEMTAEEVSAQTRREDAQRLIASAKPKPVIIDHGSDLGSLGSLWGNVPDETQKLYLDDLPAHVWDDVLESDLIKSAAKRTEARAGILADAWGRVRKALLDGGLEGWCSRTAAADVVVPSIMWGKDPNAHCHKGNPVVVDKGPPGIGGMPYVALAALHAILGSDALKGSAGPAERSSHAAIVARAKTANLTAGEVRLKRAVDETWPTGKLPGRAADRDKLIRGHYSDRRETPPTVRAIQRYFQKSQSAE